MFSSEVFLHIFHHMSGTARLIGHNVQILADNPIVGPLPTQTVVSVDATLKAGYAPVAFIAAPSVAQVIPAATTQVMAIAGLINTPYFPASGIPNGLNISTATLATNTISVAAKSFRGRVFVQFILTTNKPAALTPVENVGLILSVTDNLVTLATRTSTLPITIPTGSNNVFTWDVPVFVPYAATRTNVNFQVSLANFQTGNTLTVQTTTQMVVIQDS